MPAWVTAQNVKFNGTNTNAALLKNNAGVKTVVLWDNLSAADQDFLTAVVNSYGGTVPLGGPIAGKQYVDFNATLVGGNASGLSAIAAATAGIVTIDLGTAKVGGAASGLSQLITGKNRHTYSAHVIIDGSIVKSVSFQGVAGTTITNVITELNVDLGASATAALTGGDIVITSATTGKNSSVRIIDLGLFRALTGYTSIVSIDGVSPTTYTAGIVVDGVNKPISVVGNTVQTFTTVIGAINTALGASATAALSGTQILIDRKSVV